MLDELPMIYSALIMSYSLIEHYNIRRKYGRWLPVLLTLHGTLTTVLVAFPAIAPEYSSPLLQFICFQISFALLQGFIIYRNIKMFQAEKDQNIRRLHSLGLVLWCAGIACWLVDYLGCDGIWEGESSLRKRLLYVDLSDGHRIHMPNPQFHAWWHVCASSGLYYITLVGACNRLIVLGKRAKVGVYFKIFPYVHVLPGKPGEFEEEVDLETDVVLLTPIDYDPAHVLIEDESAAGGVVLSGATTTKGSRRKSLLEPPSNNGTNNASINNGGRASRRRNQKQQQ